MSRRPRYQPWFREVRTLEAIRDPVVDGPYWCEHDHAKVRCDFRYYGLQCDFVRHKSRAFRRRFLARHGRCSVGPDGITYAVVVP